MKTKYLFATLMLMMFVGTAFGAAITNSVALSGQTVDGTGVVEGTFTANFNISNVSDCSIALDTDATALVTDVNGRWSHYFDNSVVSSEQLWIGYDIVNATLSYSETGCMRYAPTAYCEALNPANDYSTTGYFTGDVLFTQKSIQFTPTASVPLGKGMWYSSTNNRFEVNDYLYSDTGLLLAPSTYLEWFKGATLGAAGIGYDGTDTLDIWTSTGGNVTIWAGSGDGKINLGGAGNAYVENSGNITANYFIGNGSALTDVGGGDILDNEWLYLDTAKTRGIRWNTSAPAHIEANGDLYLNGEDIYLDRGNELSWGSSVGNSDAGIAYFLSGGNYRMELWTNNAVTEPINMWARTTFGDDAEITSDKELYFDGQYGNVYMTHKNVSDVLWIENDNIGGQVRLYGEGDATTSGVYLESGSDITIQPNGGDNVYIGDGGVTNYVTFDYHGHQIMTGSARAWKTVDIPVTAGTLAGYATTLDGETYATAAQYTLGPQYLRELLETIPAGDVGSAVAVLWTVPQDAVGGASSVRVRTRLIQNSDTNTGNLRMVYGYRNAADGVTITTTTNTDGTGQTVAVPGVNYGLLTDVHTYTNNFAVGDRVTIQIGRDGEDALDTYGSDAYIVGIEIQYLSNEIGTKT